MPRKRSRGNDVIEKTPLGNRIVWIGRRHGAKTHFSRNWYLKLHRGGKVTHLPLFERKKWSADLADDIKNYQIGLAEGTGPRLTSQGTGISNCTEAARSPTCPCLKERNGAQTWRTTSRIISAGTGRRSRTQRESSSTVCVLHPPQLTPPSARCWTSMKRTSQGSSYGDAKLAALAHVLLEEGSVPGTVKRQK